MDTFQIIALWSIYFVLFQLSFTSILGITTTLIDNRKNSIFHRPHMHINNRDWHRIPSMIPCFNSETVEYCRLLA